MRTLSASLLAELNLSVTRPGYFVQIDFSTPLRLSTMGDITWGGYTWYGSPVKVSNIQKDENGSQSGTLVLGNLSLDYGAIVLNEGVADRAITIYAVWAGVVEPIMEFYGVGDSAEVGDDVVISLVSQGTKTLYSPRRFINAASGFMTLLPRGTKIRIGQETITLDR